MISDFLVKPLMDMGKYLDSRVEEDKYQLVEDGIERLKWIFILIFCLGVTVGVEVVFCMLKMREVL